MKHLKLRMISSPMNGHGISLNVNVYYTMKSRFSFFESFKFIVVTENRQTINKQSRRDDWTWCFATQSNHHLKSFILIETNTNHNNNNNREQKYRRGIGVRSAIKARTCLRSLCAMVCLDEWWRSSYKFHICGTVCFPYTIWKDDELWNLGYYWTTTREYDNATTTRLLRTLEWQMNRNEKFPDFPTIYSHKAENSRIGLRNVFRN